MVRISRALLIIHLQWVWIVDSLYIELIGGLNGTNTTECNSNVTLRCRANPASGEAVWKIAETIDLNTPIAADCFGTPCDTFNTFGGRYNYTYDQSTGIADIFITPANSIDDGMSFHCYDYQSENIFPFSVKMFPKENTSTQSTSELTMNVISGCTVNAGNITFTWYSEMVNETGLQFIMNNSAPDIATEHCVCESNCSGRCFFDSFNVEKHTFATEEGEYYIYCYITSTDPDMPAISPKKSDHPFVFKQSTTYSTHSVTTTTTITETKDASASTTTIEPTTLSSSTASSSSTKTTATTAPTITTTVTQVPSSTNFAKTTSPKSSAVKDTITTTTTPTTLPSSAASSSSTTTTAITASSINTTVAQESSSTDFATTNSRKSSAVKEYTITTIAVVSSIGLFMVVSVTFSLLYVNGRRWFRRRERNRWQMGHFGRHRAEIRPDSELSIIRM